MSSSVRPAVSGNHRATSSAPGTAGILERAALRALIDLPAVIAQLQATTFYGPPDIIAAMLARDAARRAH